MKESQVGPMVTDGHGGGEKAINEYNALGREYLYLP